MSADLAPHMEAIARMMLGDPNRLLSSKTELRWGNNGSLSINLRKGTFYDHENKQGGGVLDLVCREKGFSKSEAVTWASEQGFIEPRERRSEHKQKRRSGPSRHIEATFDYVDESGAVLFQVMRYGFRDASGAPILNPKDGKPKKTFRQGHMVNGELLWNVTGVRLVPYRLPELHEAIASERLIFIAEGEKKVDRLVQAGVPATCNPMGAGNWPDALTAHFAGARVIILPDNDDAGRKHGALVAEKLRDVAASLRILDIPDLQPKGDVFDWLEEGHDAQELYALVEAQALPFPEAPRSDGPNEDAEEAKSGPGAQAKAGQQPRLQIFDAGDIDIASVPPRAWLLGISFCREFLSGLIGGGGDGKTTIRYLQFLALASGRDLTGEYVHVRARVLICCLEDNLAEVKRRILAAMLHHGVKHEEIKGWLFYCTPRGLKLMRADPRLGYVVGELHSELKSAINRLHIDLAAIDPFVKAHDVAENDNTGIDHVCSMLTDLSDECHCATDIASHARKGLGMAGDAERDRGASAKKDAGRLMRTVTVMTREEAALVNVEEKDRWRFIRVDDAKINIAPKADKATWFKLVGVRIGNTFNPIYPHGDEVQTVERWHPPSLFAGIDVRTANRILNKIEAGPYEGGRYSPAPNAKERAAGPVIQEFCSTFSEKQARHVLNTWIKKGVLVVRDHEDPKHRKVRPGLFVEKRPGDTWNS